MEKEEKQEDEVEEEGEVDNEKEAVKLGKVKGLRILCAGRDTVDTQ
jgi:hypothetical protein